MRCNTFALPLAADVAEGGVKLRLECVELCPRPSLVLTGCYLTKHKDNFLYMFTVTY
jgi:hypothetical protein